MDRSVFPASCLHIGMQLQVIVLSVEMVKLMILKNFVVFVPQNIHSLQEQAVSSASILDISILIGVNVFNAQTTRYMIFSSRNVSPAPYNHPNLQVTVVFHAHKMNTGMQPPNSVHNAQVEGFTGYNQRYANAQLHSIGTMYNASNVSSPNISIIRINNANFVQRVWSLISTRKYVSSVLLIDRISMDRNAPLVSILYIGTSKFEDVLVAHMEEYSTRIPINVNARRTNSGQALAAQNAITPNILI